MSVSVRVNENIRIKREYNSMIQGLTIFIFGAQMSNQGPKSNEGPFMFHFVYLLSTTLNSIQLLSKQYVIYNIQKYSNYQDSRINGQDRKYCQSIFQIPHTLLLLLNCCNGSIPKSESTHYIAQNRKSIVHHTKHNKQVSNPNNTDPTKYEDLLHQCTI